MYNLAPPAAKYEEEGQAIRALARSEDGLCNAANRSPSRSTRQTACSHRQKGERYTSFVDVLAQQFKEQTIMRKFTFKRLKKEKWHWFSHSKSRGWMAGCVAIDVCCELATKAAVLA